MNTHEAEVVASTLEEFAQLIGIAPNELADYSATDCEHLLRKFLACQTHDVRTSPQKVLAMVDHNEVERVDFESNGQVWSMAKTTPVDPAFYIYVAGNARLEPSARKNPTFRRFAKHLNAGLKRDQYMNDHEVWLVYHLLNAMDTNARQVLQQHFDGDTQEVNRVYNAMTTYVQQEHTSDRGQSLEHREHTGNAIAAMINGASFPMFAQGQVYIGATALGAQKNDTEKEEQDAMPKQMTSFPLELGEPQQRVWTPQAESALRGNNALEAFRQRNELGNAFSRRSLWKQAILAAVVPESRRDAVSKYTMDTLVGRKQYTDQTWESGREWLSGLSYAQWDDFWKTLGPHVNAHAILTANDRTLNQTKVLNDALCSELTPGTVQERYPATEMLRLLVTTHLPEEFRGVLLKPEEVGSRATLRALTMYHEQCPHVGRALLQAMCDV